MNEFEIEAEQLTDLACQQRLKVLIWGPGKPRRDSSTEAKKGYKKRCDIRKALRKNFPRSRIEFSENLKTKRIIDLFTQEAVHAASADLVIILAISRGSQLELDHYTDYSWFRSKVWLLMPQAELNTPGMVEEAYKLIPPDQRRGYTDAEFDRCDVAKVMAVNITTTVATKLLLARF